jgi:predicted acyltransferase
MVDGFLSFTFLREVSDIRAKLPAMSSPNQRFLALDVFRGMTICFMIIVNTPGGPVSFAPLEHAKWFGFTPTDLVFPSFLFAVGNAMSFVMAKWTDLPQSVVLGKIFKRTIIIFLIGYLMYWFPFVEQDQQGHFMLAPISHTRIFGVLQRIALCYCAASLLVYYFKPKNALMVAVGILLLYWPIMMWFGDKANPLGMTSNFGYKLDMLLIGENHMYHGEGVAFEPEGIFSTLPAIANVIGGFMVGRFLQQKGKTYEALAKLLLTGFGLLTIAYFWDLAFPISKKLWTSSFTLYTVGLDCIIIASIIYTIDFLKKTSWTGFFTILGKNPLFIYLVSELAIIILYVIRVEPHVSLHHWLYQHIYRHAGWRTGSLLFAISWMLVCWLVGYFLDKKKIYVRV